MRYHWVIAYFRCSRWRTAAIVVYNFLYFFVKSTTES